MGERRWRHGRYGSPPLADFLISLDAGNQACVLRIRLESAYRYVLQPETADLIALSGRYIEVTPHSRLVYTSLFAPKGVEPADEADAVVVTVTFDARQGRTHLVAHALYPSKEVLDGAVASGLERSLKATMDQLDELVASLR